MFSTKKLKNRFLTVIILLLFSSALFSETYESVYPKQYTRALGLKHIYMDLLKEQNVSDPEFYIALVFPEMERYTSKRDKLETLLNKINYTTISEYEGYSIGPFQMKPNFAKEIEQCVLQNQILQQNYPELLFNSTETDFIEKYNRILRLQSKTYQISYLKAFVDICRIKYNLQNVPTEQQLRIISTAYNVGLLNNREDFIPYMNIKSFPFTTRSSKSKWNYGELVLHYYKQFKQ